MKWIKEHPTQDPDDPLWIQEHQTKKKNKKYKYGAIRMKFKRLMKKTGIDKPTDLYNFRHSACVIAKKSNFPEEEAARKFGHSVEYYTKTYGRLSVKDSIDRIKKHYDIEKEKEQEDKNVRCKCGHINPPQTEICEQCGQPTTIKKALEMKSEKDKRIENMQDRLEKLEQQQKKHEKFEKIIEKLQEQN